MSQFYYIVAMTEEVIPLKLSIQMLRDVFSCTNRAAKEFGTIASKVL